MQNAQERELERIQRDLDNIAFLVDRMEDDLAVLEKPTRLVWAVDAAEMTAYADLGSRRHVESLLWSFERTPEMLAPNNPQPTRYQDHVLRRLFFGADSVFLAPAFWDEFYDRLVAFQTRWMESYVADIHRAFRELIDFVKDGSNLEDLKVFVKWCEGLNQDLKSFELMTQLEVVSRTIHDLMRRRTVSERAEHEQRLSRVGELLSPKRSRLRDGAGFPWEDLGVAPRAADELRRFVADMPRYDGECFQIWYDFLTHDPTRKANTDRANAVDADAIALLLMLNRRLADLGTGVEIRLLTRASTLIGCARRAWTERTTFADDRRADLVEGALLVRHVRLFPHLASSNQWRTSRLSERELHEDAGSFAPVTSSPGIAERKVVAHLLGAVRSVRDRLAAWREDMVSGSVGVDPIKRTLQKEWWDIETRLGLELPESKELDRLAELAGRDMKAGPDRERVDALVRVLRRLTDPEIDLGRIAFESIHIAAHGLVLEGLPQTIYDIRERAPIRARRLDVAGISHRARLYLALPGGPLPVELSAAAARSIFKDGDASESVHPALVEFHNEAKPFKPGGTAVEERHYLLSRFERHLARVLIEWADGNFPAARAYAKFCRLMKDVPDRHEAFLLSAELTRAALARSPHKLLLGLDCLDRLRRMDAANLRRFEDPRFLLVAATARLELDLTLKHDPDAIRHDIAAAGLLDEPMKARLTALGNDHLSGANLVEAVRLCARAVRSVSVDSVTAVMAPTTGLIALLALHERVRGGRTIELSEAIGKLWEHAPEWAERVRRGLTSLRRAGWQEAELPTLARLVEPIGLVEPIASGATEPLAAGDDDPLKALADGWGGIGRFVGKHLADPAAARRQWGRRAAR